MTKIVQEKFQVNYPDKDSSAEDQTYWVTDMEARAKKNMPGREGFPGGDSNSRFTTLTANFNTLPPGMDIEDQEVTDQRKFNWSLSGNYASGNNAGDRTQDCTAMSLRKGFDRKKLLSTDDMYTREHNDAFYDEVDVEGDVGFVERNNNLDRL